MMPVPTQAEGYTGQDFVLDRLPDLLVSPHTTAGPSVPSDGPTDASERWSSSIDPWQDFKQEIRQRRTRRKPSTDRCLYWTIPGRPYTVAEEHFLCGEEKGVKGRFNQQVSQIMSCVAKDNDIAIHFSDWKGSTTSSVTIVNSFSKLPDFCAQREGPGAPSESKNKVVFVGEAKADWKGELLRAVHKDRPIDPRLCARWFGQIGRYLWSLNLQYGYITTYFYTVLLRFKKHPAYPGQSTLYFSPPIRHSEKSKDENEDDDDNEAEEEDANENEGQIAVSVRECFWFLLNQDPSNYIAPNLLGRGMRRAQSTGQHPSSRSNASQANKRGESSRSSGKDLSGQLRNLRLS